MPYPFGADGNPVDDLKPDGSPVDGDDPATDPCLGPSTTDGKPYGPGWQGEFSGSGLNLQGNPPCYLQVTSLAFRAWNRGLAALSQPFRNNDLTAESGAVHVAFGVWLYNGSDWFPDPTFPGSSACPGSTVLWAGKLDYWLIGSRSTTGGAGPQLTLCRFDGTSLVWEPLSLPATTLARLPVVINSQTGAAGPAGGVTSGACYAWNNCWFFGTDGIQVHWDGQQLADASVGLSTSPWLQDDFTAAAAGTDTSGAVFGLAVAGSGRSTGGGFATQTVQGTNAPDGSPPSQLFASQGGSFAPTQYSPTATPPFTADLTAASADSQGDAWIAADPVAWVSGSPNVPQSAQPAPLDRLSEGGARAPCPGYGPATPSPFTLGQFASGYTWTGIGAVNDGSAFASALYKDSAQTFPVGQTTFTFVDNEPAFVHADCGQSPTVTEFRRPDPLSPNQGAGAPLVPSDPSGFATAVAAPAANDAWAATTDGSWQFDVQGGVANFGSLRPHVYQWTDGQAVEAPAGDDNEARPSLFTLDPPVFQVSPPTVVVTPVVTTTTTKRNKTRKVKLKPAIYAIQSKVVRSAAGTYTLYLTFKVRRPVTIGLEGLRGGRVVASTGLKHFKGHSGQLALTLDRNHWPTKLRLQTPKPGKKVADAPPTPPSGGVNLVKATQ